jgi:hypothetical protein
MNKNRGLKGETIRRSFNEEAINIKDKVVIRTCDIREIKLAEINIQQPYSVFALCKLYEHFQRN